jgi:carboxypeptidase Taq
MPAEQNYVELIRRIREASLLDSSSGLLGWDERTHMPRAGSNHRGEQMALLARLRHEMVTDPAVGELLSRIEASPLVADVDSDAAANVREIRRRYNRAVKVPKELVEEIARVTTRAQQVWQDARQADDFAAFLPWLDKVVRLKREEANAVGYRDVPYDALLDEFEPGATTAEITETFRALRDELVPLVAAITTSGRRPNRSVLEGEFAVPRQESFGRDAATALGFDFEAGRLDVTTHPFCSGIGPGDCRICTRYNSRSFVDSFFGILHEAGHGIYEQGLPAEHFGTPRGGCASLGIHESQSRLWENQVGRGRAFWKHFFPKAREAFPGPLRDVAPDDLYFAINDVRPSFIRVEADEATYNLHILLRFELEQALVSGDLQPSNVPGAWNERVRHYLGLTPPTYALGCLQDIHWSFGGIGYFPTYALGNLYAAQFMETAKAELPNLEGDFARGDFSRLKGWLRDKIHSQGQRYRAAELCRRVTGQQLSHRPLLSYLREKFVPLYGI